MNKPIRVLYVDDSSHDRALVRDALEYANDDFKVVEAATRQEFETQLESGSFDVILSDFNILGYTGLQVLDLVADRHAELPVVIVTGTGSEEIGVEAMRRGAADYVIKTPRHIRRLPQSIHRVLETRQLRIEKKRASAALQASEALFRSLASVAPVGIFRIDSLGECNYCNMRWSEIAGTTPTAPIGMGWIESIHPDDRDVAVAELTRKIATGAHYHGEFRILRPDGQIVWVLAQAVHDGGSMEGEIGYIGTITDISESVERQIELMHLTYHDDLTRLLNRRAILEKLDSIFAGRGERAIEIGIVALNVDRLHQINDTLGYEVGNRALQHVAAQLLQLAQEFKCTVGRVGGDEFVMISTGGCSNQTLDDLAKHCMRVLSEPFEVDGQLLYLTCCTGISRYHGDDKTASRLLSEADLALNAAKRRGRAQTEIFQEGRSFDVAERIILGSELRRAHDRNELQLHYQPLIDATTGLVSGAESLMRWNNSRLGAVGPAQFIPAAEDSGFIVQLGEWALKTAIDQLIAWRSVNRRIVPISVNVSARQFHQVHFIDELEELFRETGVPTKLLKFEITESILMSDEQATIDMLHRLRGIGVRISLDDFGTGYSSLGYLRSLPIHEIKIDRSFVQGVVEDKYAAALCKAIVTMSRELNLIVIAEGVETEAQARFLKAAGCHQLQGFLFSHAVPSCEMGKLLEDDASWALDGHRQVATVP